MEGFFPIPKNSKPIEVPILSHFEYDPVVTSFEAFPQSYTGYDAGGAQSVDISFLQNLDPGECPKFLQQWLFFGLLAEFLGRSIKTEEFSTQGIEYESVLMVDTLILHDALSKWQKAATARSQTRHLATLDLLRFATHQSEIFDMAMVNRCDRSLGQVSLSVKLLIEFLTGISNATFVPRAGLLQSFSQFYSHLEHAVWKECREISVVPKLEQSKVLSTAVAANEWLTPAAWFLLEVFASNGWCRSQVRQICQLYDYSTINYLALLSRELPPSGNHNKCKGQMKCIAFNLDPETNGLYSTAHYQASCECRNLNDVLYLKVEEIGAIIRKGAIPILYMDLKQSEPHIYVTELNYLMQYFAVSHVWSDGLGNEVQNGIRLCQANRLQKILKLAESLHDSKSIFANYEKWASKGGVFRDTLNLVTWKRSEHRVYFWLDTFCIPAGNGTSNPEVGELRLKALKHITPIFSGATAVLILDSELQKMRSGWSNNNERIKDEELAARILATKWMQRAWTLEEGSLARKCFFVVGDTLQVLRQSSVIVDPLGRRIVDSFRSTCKIWKKISLLDFSVAQFKNKVPRIVEQILNEERKQAFAVSSNSRRKEQIKRLRLKQFVHSWNNLLRRTTTKPRDMQTIFANVLDFNASSISRLHPNDGLVAILRSCQELPLSLLYNAGPRLQNTSAIEDAWIPISISGYPLHDHGILRRTISGLKIETKGIDLDSIDTWIIGVKIPFQMDLFCIQDGSTGQQYVVEKQTGSSQIDVQFDQKMQELSESAIATSIFVDKRDCTASLDGYSGRGVLFHVCSYINASQDIEVQFGSPLRFWTFAQWQQQNAPENNIDPSSLPSFSAQRLPYDQNLVLKLAPLEWNSPFPQRPLFIPRTNTFTLSQVIAVISGLILVQVVNDSLYGEDGKDHDGLKLLGRTIIQLALSTLIIRGLQYRSKRTYLKWLATFEEGWRPDADREREWAPSRAWRKWLRNIYRLSIGRDRLGEIEL